MKKTKPKTKEWREFHFAIQPTELYMPFKDVIHRNIITANPYRIVRISVTIEENP